MFVTELVLFYVKVWPLIFVITLMDFLFTPEWKLLCALFLMIFWIHLNLVLYLDKGMNTISHSWWMGEKTELVVTDTVRRFIMLCWAMASLHSIYLLFIAHFLALVYIEFVLLLIVLVSFISHLNFKKRDDWAPVYIKFVLIVSFHI